MLNYEGENVSDDRRLNLQMETDGDEARKVFEASAISADAYESHVDATISSVFVANDNYISDTGHVYDADGLSKALSLKGEISKFAATIGTCTISEESCSLFETNIDSIHDTINTFIHPDSILEMQASLSSLAADKSVGVDLATLSKLWLISEPLAQGAIDQNTQLCRHYADNTLSRQFSTNDRMLRYRRIQSVFFTDTMFATSKAKSTRGNTCFQVFVSDKGFVAVYPMKSQSDFETALH